MTCKKPAIAKAVEDSPMKPTDNTSLFWMRMKVYALLFLSKTVGDGVKLIKGQIPLQHTHPTKYVL